jgi:hypothetical protein
MTSSDLLDCLFLEAIQSDRNLRTRQELEVLLASRSVSPRSRVHDWRNYLSEAVVEQWPDLSLETRLVAFAMASAQAHAEEWD